MALGILGIICMIAIILDIVALGVLFLKNGDYARNDKLFYLILIYTLLLSFMQFTSAATNDIVGRFIGYLFGGLTILSLLMKNRNFLISRILVSIGFIGATFTVFFG